MTRERKLYEHLRSLGYSVSDALRWAYGPRDLPIVEWLRWMGVML